MRRFVCLMLLWPGCGCLVSAADEPLVTKPAIRPPMVPVLKDPRPEAAPLDQLTEPTLVTELRWGHLLVYEADMRLLILHSPDGAIAVKEHEVKSGNEFIAYGQFADGIDGDDGEKILETREYSGPFVYVITGRKTASIELIAVPVGVTTEAEIIRQKLAVSGKGPRPPPDPEPDPEPKPDPDPVPTPVKSFRVIFVKESSQTLNAQQTAIPGAKEIRDYLNAKTTQEGGQVGWREFDPDFIGENEPQWMKKLWESVKPKLKPAPCMVIEVNGTATVMAFPANVAEAMATLKKHGGE